MSETIMIIDDNIPQLRMKEHALQEKLHYQTLHVAGNEEAVRLALTGRKFYPDLVLVDLETLGVVGYPIIRAVRAAKNDLPVLAFTAYGDHDQIHKVLQAGAHDFLTKPVIIERLKLSLQHLMKIKRMGSYIGWLERKIAGHVDFTDIIGHSRALKDSLSLAQAAAASKVPVWIEGESGTGKELLARAVHGSSDRAGKPFVVIDCETLPEHMAEIVLFGQDKGFHPSNLHFVLGKLREADQGTLLVKEMSMLKPELQSRLLNVLQSEALTPVGSASRIKVDIRVICTTSRPTDYNSPEKIDAALLHRIRQTVITMPSLQQRQSDIALLAEHFLAVHAASENKYIQGLTDRALQWLINNPWPGNVRQLANTIWRAVMLCDQEQLDVGDLQLVQKSKPIYFSEFMREGGSGAALIDEKGHVKTLKSVEGEAIRFALQQANGCMTRAAKNLGIGRSTLYRKVGELEITGYISRANQTIRPMMTVSSTERS